MAASERVHLRGGLTVAEGALRLLWRLEDEGFTVGLLDDDRLQVLPLAQLTPGLAQRIREHRDELVMLVRYQPDDSHLFTVNVSREVPDQPAPSATTTARPSARQARPASLPRGTAASCPASGTSRLPRRGRLSQARQRDEEFVVKHEVGMENQMSETRRSAKEQSAIDEFLAIRREAGSRIDPQTAEVASCAGEIGDPYGIGQDYGLGCVGRLFFARAPGSDIWVSSYDLPEGVADALGKKHQKTSPPPINRLPRPADPPPILAARLESGDEDIPF